MKLKRFLTIAGTTAWLLSMTMGELHACEACNKNFAEEIAGSRKNTIIGKELRKTMENQKNLPLDGLKAGYLIEQEKAEREAAALAAKEAGKPEEVKEVAKVTPRARELAPDLPVLANPEPVPAGVSIPWIPEPVHKATTELPDYMKDSEFIEIIERDYALGIPPTSTVPQNAPIDKSFTIELDEGKTYIGNGVVYDGFLTNGKIPGPTLIMDEGDIVEFKVVNKGAIPHGASIHPANTQTSKYLGKIQPGETGRVVFKAAQPGVYMYHCAPGGHAIPMHVLFGQYGMMVVKPKQKYELENQLGHGPDIELYMIQHEMYASGEHAITSKADYVMFNGKTFRYIEKPVEAKPGDYIRIYFLNIGPNLLSTFHIVGIVWDYAYWQGHPAARFPGGQSVTAGPTDSWVIEFRAPPDEGMYTILNHAVGSTSRGAIGFISVSRDANVEPVILAEGPDYTPEELKEYEEGAIRTISPFKIGTHPVDDPVVYGPETKEVKISIIGNSYHPKVVQVAPGTKITWVNEDVFTYLAGEFAGIHNVASLDAPEGEDNVISDLLAHGESFSHTFDTEWQYDYICTPHPYMQGRIIVKAPEYSLGAAGSGGGAGSPVDVNSWIIGLLGICFILSTIALVSVREKKAKVKS